MDKHSHFFFVFSHYTLGYFMACILIDGKWLVEFQLSYLFFSFTKNQNVRYMWSLYACLALVFRGVTMWK